MTFGQSINTCFLKYATFEGRATRSEYWWWVFATFFVSEIARSAKFNMFYLEFFLITYLPSVAVSVRRLHDIGKSCFWYGIFLLADLTVLLWALYINGFVTAYELGYDFIIFASCSLIISFIVKLFFFCRDSQPENNDYGLNPKTNLN